ncbi:MAG: hypothetical protein P4L33_07990 [Capsulimonadaceae bacterium]|nr:hypothetical protein [Capsulimonadaceae bacterium]
MLTRTVINKGTLNRIRAVIALVLVCQIAVQSVATARTYMRCAGVAMTAAECRHSAMHSASCPSPGPACCCHNHSGAQMMDMAGADMPPWRGAVLAARCETFTQIASRDLPALAASQRQWFLGATASQAPPAAVYPVDDSADASPAFLRPASFALAQLHQTDSHGLRAPPIA